ncbi:MAG: hypothetical protein DRR19_19140 [Candidatus Parabeggiatoa sp. nov. 1]|nr:MAG: hypothetical protein DRR19_19140 [Gammaproteobacteria bacterium]
MRLAGFVQLEIRVKFNNSDFFALSYFALCSLEFLVFNHRHWWDLNLVKNSNQVRNPISGKISGYFLIFSFCGFLRLNHRHWWDLNLVRNSNPIINLIFQEVALFDDSFPSFPYSFLRFNRRRWQSIQP